MRPSTADDPAHSPTRADSMVSSLGPEPLSAFTPPGILGSLRKYYNIFRVSLVERLTYRGDFFLSTFLRFLPMVTTILLWEAIYAGADTDSVAGFSRRQMIAYLLLVHISRMFSSMPGLAMGIARDIREGTLKKYLIQPLDMIGYLLCYRLAHKAVYMLTVILPYALLFFLCRSYLGVVQPDLITCVAYVAALLLGFVVGFFFETCLGMVGFWFLEVSSLLYVVSTLNYFVSGHMFPLDLLPAPWPAFLRLLPFQYLAYFPAMIILGKVQGAELVWGLGIEVLWAVVLVLLSRWLYARGLRRYSAYGG
jgi:viologen exporter family transport system permease protein